MTLLQFSVYINPLVAILKKLSRPALPKEVRTSVIEDLFIHLKTNGVINFDRFKRMHTIYHCLTDKHVEILFNKKLIFSIQRSTLLEMLTSKLE